MLKLDRISTEIISNLENLNKYMGIFIPKDDTDLKILKIGQDMIQCVIDDLRNPLIDDSEILNTDIVNRQYDTIIKSLKQPHDRDIIAMMNNVIEEYEDNDE